MKSLCYKTMDLYRCKAVTSQTYRHYSKCSFFVKKNIKYSIQCQFEDSDTSECTNKKAVLWATMLNQNKEAFYNLLDNIRFIK